MANDSAFRVNWRNIGILFFLWTLVCVAVLRGIKTARWVSQACVLHFRGVLTQFF